MAKEETNKEFDWTGLGEISGFGGEYEAECRKMTKAGVEWLRKNGKPKNMGPIMDACAKVCDDCTGAMVGEAAKHACFIFANGWEKYAKDMKKAREKKG